MDLGSRPVVPTDPGAAPDVERVAPRPGVAVAAGGGLSARDRAVLDFERRRWRHRGAKEQAVRDTFDLSATRYYQVLNALLDDPAALAAEPLLVQRLRRLRDTRRGASSGESPQPRA